MVTEIIQICLHYGLIQPNQDRTITEEDETAAVDE